MRNIATKRSLFDVDIDVTPSTERTNYGYARAMIYNADNQRIQPHPSGVYLEEVPVDPITNLCAFDYEYGDEQGFMKVDLLHNTVYENFKSKQEVLEASEAEIDWELFSKQEIVETLPHIAKHFEVVDKVKPKSVDDLADILALIRPGKIQLLEDYLINKEQTRRNLYRRPRQGIYFKKSHAISYALMIKALVAKKFNNAMIYW